MDDLVNLDAASTASFLINRQTVIQLLGPSEFFQDTLMRTGSSIVKHNVRHSR